MSDPIPKRISILEPLRKDFQTEERELSKFEALCYLILHGPEIQTSTRELASMFDWSRSRVEDFIAELTKKATLEPVRSQEGTTLKVSQAFYITHESATPTKAKKPQRSQEGATKEPLDPTLHPSPNAPAWLTRETQELECYDDTLVYFTLKQRTILQTRFKPAEFEYWVGCMDRYFKGEPAKYRGYKSHYLVLLRWYEKRQQEGMVWAELPDLGRGYFKSEVINKNFRLA